MFDFLADFIEGIVSLPPEKVILETPAHPASQGVREEFFLWHGPPGYMAKKRFIGSGEQLHEGQCIL